jgi:hypothetical protein
MRTKVLGSAAILAAAMVTVSAWGDRARADTIVTFNASGTYQDGGALSGTLTIDTTTGTITAADLTVGAPDSFTVTSLVSAYTGYSSLEQAYSVDVVGSSDVPQVILLLATSSLVGYDGSQIYGVDDLSPGNYASDLTRVDISHSLLESGTMTSNAATPAPEPNTIALLGCGLLGLGLVYSRKRSRRDTTAAHA